MFELERSSHLADEQWLVIETHLRRIHGSRIARDWSQGVGSAKELVESVARVVLAARGETVGNSTKFPELVHAAHQVLERPRGADLADDEPSRQVVKQAKAIASTLAQLRNGFGTGHGPAAPQETREEHADLALDAAVLWSRWALRRLSAVAEGRHADLIGDLREKVFYAGDLARRLAAVNLASIDEEEQRVVGVAVGRRAAGGTFNVRDEGVAAAAEGDKAWPLAYRLGVVEGLFIGDDGFVRSWSGAAGYVASLLDGVDRKAIEAIDALMESVLTSDLSYSNDLGERLAIAAALRGSTRQGMNADVERLVRVLADKFDPPF
jgi:hypothetical protein